MFEIQQTAEFSRWLAHCAMLLDAPPYSPAWVAWRFGNAGDAKPVGSGVSELRIDVGPGYRTYYMRSGERIYLVLGGGDKSTQARDIARAIAMADVLRASTRVARTRRPK
jgi:putative addiction module killer protein